MIRELKLRRPYGGRNMNKKITLLLVAICCLTGACWYYYNHRQNNPDQLTLYGNIEIRQVDLSFQVGGKISKMLKEEGDTVQAQELVAVLDDKDYSANVRIAAANVAQTKALLDDSKLKFDRSNALWEKKAISQQTFDSARYDLDKSKANYQAAVSQELFAMNQLAYTELFAPEEGIITVRVAEPGATVAAGQNIYTLSKNKPVWIRAFVNETQLGNIKYNMPAQVLTDTVNPATGQRRSYEGRIGYISPVAEFTPKTVQSTDLRTSLVYRIRVYVDEPDDFLRQGMPTTVTINLK